ncbi:hypothetical protein GOBAR_AA12221 [Gossypium barbadense]|uniref:DUF676 domain-containing protein n=1 Tax=Gossypium barbadense TaxID=3634 RepID=A0A2P5XYR2_GOSBA|nr:hypothetical protein GOBAR_AA12221 [Gossypium barbadense]
MLRRLGWLIGLIIRSLQAKKLPDAKPHPAEVQPVVMLDSEIAIYIHRFHNLDLFQQGWYQLKLTVRWDTDEYAPVGTPARVVQYEGNLVKLLFFLLMLPLRHKIRNQFDYVVDQALDQVASTDLKQVMLVKALLNALDTLLAELQKLSAAINHAVHLTEFTSKMNDMKLFDSFLQEPVAADAEDSAQGKPQNGLERVNGRLEFQSDRLLHNLSKDDVLKIFNLSGDQVFYLWNTFLNFHRDSKTRILDVLRDEWAKDRRAEWSIWMVYSKVDMPHRYINGSFDESSHQIVHKRGSSLWKLTDDPAQMAAMRAELHRRSIAQMRMNNRSIQDMQIYGDPSGIPIVIIEHVMNATQCTSSDNLYMRNLDIIDSITASTVPSSEAVKKLSSASAAQSGRDLKIVIFVHGFQGHHLDLRLIEFLMSEKMDKASRSGDLRDIKLSFIGHSIGNFIIRTALAESAMEPYLRFLHTFVSLSGPHLGYLYSSNSLFNSGLWLLEKLKGTQCIHQLTFADDRDIRNTLFHKLCEVLRTKLQNDFKHIILLSLPQVFHHSPC